VIARLIIGMTCSSKGIVANNTFMRSFDASLFPDSSSLVMMADLPNGRRVPQNVTATPKDLHTLTYL
jgi:hypothetical protein